MRRKVGDCGWEKVLGRRKAEFRFGVGSWFFNHEHLFVNVLNLVTQYFHVFSEENGLLQLDMYVLGII